MESFYYIGIHTTYLLIFSIALGLGIGASALSHLLFLQSDEDSKISRDEFKYLLLSRKVVWVALLLYGFSGVGLFSLAYESMLVLGIFYASMTVAFILFVNEVMFLFRHLPRIQNKKNNVTIDAYILESGTVSVVSWIFLMFHHVIYRIDIGYFAFMGLYAFILALSMLITWFAHNKKVGQHDKKILKRSVIASLILASMFALGWYINADNIFHTKETAKIP